MIPYGLLAIGLAIVVLLVYRAGRIWRDAGRWGFSPPARLGWAALGAVVPSLYWWGVRVDALLLEEEREDLDLEGVDSARCPLCGAEIPGAWALTEDTANVSRPATSPGPALGGRPCCACFKTSPRSARPTRTKTPTGCLNASEETSSWQTNSTEFSW